MIRKEYDQSIIVYRVGQEKVYGGSDHNPDGRSVRQEMKKDGPFGFYIGGDFKMELDYAKKTLSFEENGEKVIIDANVGDFQYSPIVILRKDEDSPEFEITLL